MSEDTTEAQLAQLANIVGNMLFLFQGIAADSRNVLLMASAQDATKSFEALMRLRGEKFELPGMITFIAFLAATYVLIDEPDDPSKEY